jgi:hypothetical protein
MQLRIPVRSSNRLAPARMVRPHFLFFGFTDYRPLTPRILNKKARCLLKVAYSNFAFL